MTKAQIMRQMAGICHKFANCEIGDNARKVLEDIQAEKFETFEELKSCALKVLEEVRGLKKQR